MTLKTGRLSNEEKKFISEYCELMTDDELAKQLNRRVESITPFRQKILPEKQAKDENSELFEVLYGRMYWEGVQKQFSKKEVEQFKRYWIEFMKQFDSDVIFSEEIQIVDLIKLELLKDRNLYERNRAREELEILQRKMSSFLAKNGYPPYEDEPSLNGQQQMLKLQISSCEAAYNSRTAEYKVFLDQGQKYLDELKATRKQRIEQIKNSKKDWFNLMKNMRDEKFREREGKEVALMNLAAEKEKERLSEWHQYSDGILDKPLLNCDTVEPEETQKEEE